MSRLPVPGIRNSDDSVILPGPKLRFLFMMKRIPRRTARVFRPLDGSEFCYVQLHFAVIRLPGGNPVAVCGSVKPGDHG